MRFHVIIATAMALIGAVAGCAKEETGTAATDSCNAAQKPVKAAVGFQPVFVPLKITVNTDGEIGLSLAASWTTPLGTFDLDVAKNDNKPAPPGVHRLSVSYRKDGKKVVDRYEIRCNRAYRVFLNGKFQAKVSTAETVIEAAPYTTSTIVVVDAAAPIGPDLRPLPEYQALPAAKVDLPDPIGESGLGADLDPDRMVIDHFGIGARDSDDADLFWSYGDGLSAGYDALLGSTTAATKTPQQCRRDASGRAVGKAKETSIVVGRRFCAVTTRGHVALLIVTKADWPSDHPERRSVTFLVKRWLKT